MRHIAQPLFASLLAASLLYSHAAYSVDGAKAKPAFAFQKPAIPAAIQTADEAARFNQMDKFLQETGFPDLSAQIERTLKSPEASKFEQINRDTLESNWGRMQILNYARLLASELLAKFIPGIEDSKKSEKIAEFAARILSQKRLAIPDAFPDPIRNIRNFDQRVQAKQQYLHGLVEKNIIRMQEQIVSDALATIYGRSYIEQVLKGSDQKAKQEMEAYIKRLDGLTHLYVRSLYYDHEMGLGHWLGEALALGLVHTSRLSKDSTAKNFETLLSARALAHGEYLTDAVSDTLTFEDTDGKLRKIKVNHADTITEIYSLAQGSRMSASGPRPHLMNRWKAFKQDLLQYFVYTIVTADESKSMWKALDGKEPSLMAKVSQLLAFSKPAKMGASHAGMAYVYKNKESGVAIARGIDMYAFGPMPWGGTRFVTAKSIFATPGVFANFGVASLNPERTLSYLQEKTRKKDYQAVFKVSDVYRPDESGKLVKSPEETFSWTTRITEEEQRKILDVRMEDAEKWYREDLAPRIASEMLRYITDYGMAFRTYGSDPSNKMSCYCSEGINIAGFRETGHNLQSHTERLYFAGRVAKFIYPKLRKVIYDETPIAPNFMAWDPKTDTDSVIYKIRGPLESWTEQIQAPRRDFDPSLTSLISPYLDRTIQYTEMQIGQARYSPESYAHYSEVTVVPDPKKSNQGLYVPRVYPMGVSSGDQPQRIYNLIPPMDAKAALVSEEDSKTRQLIHQSVVQAAGLKSESKAAAYILSEFANRWNDKDSVSLLTAFTAKMMGLKPINPLRSIPHEIRVLQGKARDEAVTKYVAEFTASQVESHTRQILSDVMGILYGQDPVAKMIAQPNQNQALMKKVKTLYTLIGQEVQELYLDDKAPDARSLGVNLAIGVINMGLKNGQDVVSILEQSLIPYNYSLNEFFENDLKSEKTKASIVQGNVAYLKTKGLPGLAQRERLMKAAAGKKMRDSERIQTMYSPYSEAQTSLTKILGSLFDSNPKFSGATYTRTQQNNLVYRCVEQYLKPLNLEQMGSAGDIFTSPLIEALSCKQLLAR